MEDKDPFGKRRARKMFYLLSFSQGKKREYAARAGEPDVKSPA